MLVIQPIIKDGRTTQKEIEERNEIISDTSHTTITKVDEFSIERGNTRFTKRH